MRCLLAKIATCQMITTVAGLDLAMRKDHSALVILSFDGVRAKVITDVEWLPGKVPLRPIEVVSEALRICDDYQCERICTDLHYIDLVSELRSASHDTPLVQFPTAQPQILDVFVSLRMAFGRGNVDLSMASDRLLRQLKQTTGKATAGGGMSIGQQRGKAGHGDTVSAFVAAWYLLRTAPHLENFSVPRRLLSARYEANDNWREFADED
jgi:hypothetical protein